jgi:hypothetical protein
VATTPPAEEGARRACTAVEGWALLSRKGPLTLVAQLMPSVVSSYLQGSWYASTLPTAYIYLFIVTSAQLRSRCDVWLAVKASLICETHTRLVMICCQQS